MVHTKAYILSALFPCCRHFNLCEMNSPKTVTIIDLYEYLITCRWPTFDSVSVEILRIDELQLSTIAYPDTPQYSLLYS